MRKILLLAGTGTIGKSIVSLLKKEKNTELYITSRKSYKSESNIHYYCGDAHNSNFLNKVLSDIDNIDVIIDFLVWSVPDFEKNIKNILKSCKKYVYISSARVYAETKGFIDEKSKRLYDVEQDKYFLKKDTYAVPKSMQEDILKKSGYSNYIVIRPYITYNNNRIPLGDVEKEIWLYRVLKGRKLILPKDIMYNYTSMTFGDDCANAIVIIINESNNQDNFYNISTKEFMKWIDVFSIYKKVLEKRNIEVKVLYTEKSIKGKNFDFQTLYDRRYNRKFEVNELEKFVNVNEFKSIEEGLINSLNNFLNNPKFNDEIQDWKLQAQMDSESKEFAKKSEFTNKKQFITYCMYRFTPIAKLKRIIKKIVINLYNNF